MYCDSVYVPRPAYYSISAKSPSIRREKLDTRETIKFFLCAVTRERQLFTKYVPGVKGEVLCMSKNGRVPSFGSNVRSGSCEICRDSKWIETTEGKKPPACVENMVFWGIEEQDFVRFRISFRRRAIPIAKKFVQQVMVSSKKGRFATALLKMAKEGNSEYYFPVLSSQRDVADAEIVAECEEYASFVGDLVAGKLPIPPSPDHQEGGSLTMLGDEEFYQKDATEYIPKDGDLPSHALYDVPPDDLPF